MHYISLSTSPPGKADKVAVSQENMDSFLCVHQSSQSDKKSHHLHAFTEANAALKQIKAADSAMLARLIRKDLNIGIITHFASLSDLVYIYDLNTIFYITYIVF